MSSSTGGNVSQAAGIAAQFGINLPTGQSETKWVYPEIIKSKDFGSFYVEKEV